jgi:hypothetical protein
MLTDSRPLAMRSMVAICRASCAGPVFTDSNRHQQLDPPGQGGHRRRKGRRVDAQRIAGRKQNIVKAAAFGLQDDIATMFEARLQPRVGNAEKLVVVVAQSDA